MVWGLICGQHRNYYRKGSDYTWCCHCDGTSLSCTEIFPPLFQGTSLGGQWSSQPGGGWTLASSWEMPLSSWGGAPLVPAGQVHMMYGGPPGEWARPTAGHDTDQPRQIAHGAAERTLPSVADGQTGASRRPVRAKSLPSCVSDTQVYDGWQVVVVAFILGTRSPL